MATPPIVNCDTCGGAPAGTPLPTWVKICSDSPGGGGGGGGGPAGPLADVEKVPICYTTAAPAPPPSVIPPNIAGNTRTIVPTNATPFSTGAGTSYTPATNRTLTSMRWYISGPGTQRRIQVWEGGTAPTAAAGSTQLFTVDDVWQNPPNASTPWTFTFPTPVAMTAGTKYWILLMTTGVVGQNLIIPVVPNTAGARPEGAQLTLTATAPVWSEQLIFDLIGDLFFDGATAPGGGGGGGAVTPGGQPVQHGFLITTWNGSTGAFATRVVQDLAGNAVTGATLVPCSGSSVGSRPDLEPVCYQLQNSTAIRPGFLVVAYDSNGGETGRTLQDAVGQPVTNGLVVSCDAPQFDTERSPVCYRTTTGVETPLNLSLTQTGTTSQDVMYRDSPDGGFAQLWNFPEDRKLKKITPRLAAGDGTTTARVIVRIGDSPNNAPTTLYTSPPVSVPQTMSDVEFFIPDITIAKNINHIVVVNFQTTSGVSDTSLSAVTTGNPVSGRTWERNVLPDGTVAPTWGILDPDHDFTWPAEFTTQPDQGPVSRGYLAVIHAKATGEEVSRRVENRIGQVVSGFTIVDCPEQAGAVPADTERSDICYLIPGSNNNFTIAANASNVTQADTTEWGSGIAQQLRFGTGRHMYQITAQGVSANIAGVTTRLRIAKGTDANSAVTLYTGQSQPVSTAPGNIQFPISPPVTFDSGEDYQVIIEFTAPSLAQITMGINNTDVRTGQIASEKEPGAPAFQGLAPTTDFALSGGGWDLGTGVPTPGFLVVVTNGIDGTEISRRVEDRLGTVVTGTLVDCPAQAVTGGAGATIKIIDIERTDICYQPGPITGSTNGPPGANDFQVNNNQNDASFQSRFAHQMQVTGQTGVTLTSVNLPIAASITPLQALILVYEGGAEPEQGQLIGTSNAVNLPQTTPVDTTFSFTTPPNIQPNTPYWFVVQAQGPTIPLPSFTIVRSASFQSPGHQTRSRTSPANTYVNNATGIQISANTSQAQTVTQGYLVVIYDANTGAENSRRIENRTGQAVTPTPTIVDCPQPAGGGGTTPPIAPGEVDVRLLQLEDDPPGNTTTINGGFRSLSIAVTDDRVTINGVQFREGEVFELPPIPGATYQQAVVVAHTGNSDDSRIRIVEVR